MKDKRIFISGGAGVIGHALVNKLLALGAEVFVLRGGAVIHGTRGHRVGGHAGGRSATIWVRRLILAGLNSDTVGDLMDRVEDDSVAGDGVSYFRQAHDLRLEIGSGGSGQHLGRA